MSKISEKNVSLKLEGYEINREIKSHYDIVKQQPSKHALDPKYSAAHDYSTNNADLKCMNLHKDKYYFGFTRQNVLTNIQLFFLSLKIKE
jgi:hypothetical protein